MRRCRLRRLPPPPTPGVTRYRLDGSHTWLVNGPTVRPVRATCAACGAVETSWRAAAPCDRRYYTPEGT